MVQLLHSPQSNNRIHQDIKLPPHSNEAEQAVIGGLMLSDYAWDVIAGRVSEEDFYRQDHRLLFRAIAALAGQGKPRDVLTMSEYLDGSGDLEKAGGLVYLGTIAKDTPSAANVKAYADIVRERSVLRQLIQIGEQIAADGYAPGMREIPEILDAAENKIFQIAEQGKNSTDEGPKRASEYMRALLESMDQRMTQGGRISGLTTGLPWVDSVFMGLQPGNVIVIGGRPSMGKTAIAMNIAEHNAVDQNKSVLVFSMEMSAKQLLDRCASSIGGIPYKHIRKGELSAEERAQYADATSRLNKSNLWIDEKPALNVIQIRARARRHKKKHGLDLVIIDYLQLMSSTNPHSRETDNTKVSEISRSIKALAKELHVPVILLSQLNRDCERRTTNKEPMMSDLRDSGGIEQDADIIAFMYREYVYTQQAEHKGKALLLVRKNRDGELDNIMLTEQLNMMRFKPYTKEYDDRPMPPPKPDHRAGYD